MMLYAHALHFIYIFNNVSCISICVSLLEPYVLVGLDRAEPMMIFLLHITWSCIIHACVPFISFLLVLYVDWCFSISLSLSLSLSLSRIVCTWHPSAKLLCPRTLFILGHHRLIPLLFLSGSLMIKPVRNFQRTSPNVAFIRNTTLSYWTSSILLLRLSYIGGVRNLFMRYSWVVPPWLYRSFPPICMVLIILYLFSSLLFEVLV